MAVASSPLRRLPLLLAAMLLFVGLCSGRDDGAGSCPFSKDHDADHHQPHHHHHGHGDCNHHHHHDHGVGHHHGHGGPHPRVRKLPEELAEEEDLALEGFGDAHFSHDHHRHHHRDVHGGGGDHRMPTLGLWVRAMGCSLLVSMASLICLIILPLFLLKGKPSKLVVDSLAVFGAGAMLGDAFLHQLPHAFGGEHTHVHDHHKGSLHDHPHEFEHSHSHSLKDLSVGLSILAGILLFLLVEKIVRYIEDISGKSGHAQGHGYHHHHHHHLKSHDKKDDGMTSSLLNSDLSDNGIKFTSERELSNIPIRKRVTADGDSSDGQDLTSANGSVEETAPSSEMSPGSKSSLVFGYLNLFSDGVHNFTDGMALGSAFLLYGSVGGWSRTLFLLAHELPQEVGDFGILVRSGFSVSKALFFNFLSALAALAGTALALLLGKDPGQSSLIEGFTAGGFIYIAVAGVLPEMNNGSASVKSTAVQLTSFILGMAVALCISLVE
uniref:IAA-alanine resistance protein 1 n=1 Tax=Anthurium amnicola TaxID=1678845 RepID=A0A1D1Z2H9_9ARAE